MDDEVGLCIIISDPEFIRGWGADAEVRIVYNDQTKDFTLEDFLKRLGINE